MKNVVNLLPTSTNVEYLVLNQPPLLLE